MTGDLDYDRSESARIQYNAPHLKEKAINELQGIASAIIYDNKVDDNEIHLLTEWLSANDHLLGTWPVSKLAETVCDILEDGIVTNEERALLFEFVKDLAAFGKDLPETLQTIFDEEADVIIEGRIFLFTGKLVCGTRKKAETAVKERGGMISKSKSCSSDLDYLVVGTDGSKAWKFSRFGNKIDAAVSQRDSGLGNPLIVREELFIQAIMGEHSR